MPDRKPKPRPAAPDPHDAVFSEIRSRARDNVAAVADASQVALTPRRAPASVRQVLPDVGRMAARGAAEGAIGLVELPGAALELAGRAEGVALTPAMRGISGLSRWLLGHTTLREAPERLAETREAIREYWGDPQTEAGRWAAPAANLTAQLMLLGGGGKAIRNLVRTVTEKSPRNALWIVGRRHDPLPPGTPPSAPVPQVPPVSPKNLTVAQRSFLEDLTQPKPPRPAGVDADGIFYPTGLQAPSPGFAYHLSKQKARTLLSKVLGLPRQEIRILPSRPPFRGPQPPDDLLGLSGPMPPPRPPQNPFGQFRGDVDAMLGEGPLPGDIPGISKNDFGIDDFLRRPNVGEGLSPSMHTPAGGQTPPLGPLDDGYTALDAFLESEGMRPPIGKLSKPSRIPPEWWR